MASGTAAIPGEWTYEKYLELDDDQRYEIIGGELLLTPAPDTRHQIAVSELGFRMMQFVREHKLGLVLFAPTDVVLDPPNVVQPDILFIRAENMGILKERAVQGAPDLVVEILSPSSVKRDRHRKMELYARAGVPEFWIVDPVYRTIEVFSLSDTGYKLLSFGGEDERVSSGVLKGFGVEVGGGGGG